MMDYHILQTELDDPAYADLSDTEAADVLNVRDVEQVGAVSPEDFLTWCAQSGAILKLTAATQGAAENPQLASVASAALAMIQSGRMALQLGDERIAGMIDYLVQQGPFESGDRAALFALATVVVSRAEQLGIGTVTPGDVERARGGEW